MYASRAVRVNVTITNRVEKCRIHRGWPLYLSPAEASDHEVYVYAHVLSLDRLLSVQDVVFIEHC